MMLTVRLLLLSSVLCAAGLPDGLGGVPAPALGGVRVFAVYEPVFSRQDVELLSRVHPDFVCRGWFKWRHTPDWQAYAPLARACAEKGIQLQGGITLSAVYPGENGMDDATFRDSATRGTDGQPLHCRFHDGDGWYQLSLYNPKVVDYLKREARLQIDAGAAGLWYDEIEGYYDWVPNAGYDPYACAAFREWLLRTYCGGQGWRDDDACWETRFGIDLARHGGSMRTFDYLLHLRTTPGANGRPLIENPAQGHPRAWATSPNPLFRAWGYAWDRKAAGTFRFDTVAARFADIVADADRYALERYGRTLVNTYNHNGTARPGVAFLQPHNGAQPPLRKGRLDGRASYHAYYEGVVADAAEVCPGQPVVFFVDWPGETDRLTALPRSDQTHFLRLYIPEAYAAGGEFALPLRGYSYVAADQGTLGALARLADFYREYAPFLRGSTPGGADGHVRDAPDRLTVRLRTSAAGTAVHLVNHAFSAQEVWPLPLTNLVITLPWSRPAPEAAFAVSPDFPEQRPVRLAVRDGQLTLDVGTVTCSALVLMPDPNVLRAVTGTAADGTHILDPQGRALAVARAGRFSLWLPPTPPWRGGVPAARGPPGREPSSQKADACGTLECLETGERLPARDGAAFAAPPEGGFASGLLLDGFGIPARHAELAAGSRRWRTDAWGRFRVPRADLNGGALAAAVEPGAAVAFEPGDAFTAWRFFAPRTPVLEPAALEPPPTQARDNAPAADGFWANWPDKERVPGAVTLARETHGGRAALRCTFAAEPRATWSNVNSPGFTPGSADAVEVTYAGDGTPRTVFAVLHAHPRFYRAALDLSATEWSERRIPLSEFRDDSGQPFDPARHARGAAFQLAPNAPLGAPATVWLHRVTLVTAHPVRPQWRSDEAFGAVDVDNLRAGHPAQPPPPAVSAREPLLRFADASATSRLLANWDGRDAGGTKPMVTLAHVAPSGAAPALRVTFPAGDGIWANANIPLPAGRLAGRDGLALRLRVSPPSADVELALHSAPKDGGPTFYHATCEVEGGAAEVVVPWRDFVRDNGQPFDARTAAWATLQLCRPARALAGELTVDVEAIDTVTVRP